MFLGLKYIRVDQMQWIKVLFDNPFPLYFEFQNCILRLMNWFDFQIGSNDVKINIFFHIQIQDTILNSFFKKNIKYWYWKTLIIISKKTLSFEKH
jgi:hypothetical protein